MVYTLPLVLPIPHSPEIAQRLTGQHLGEHNREAPGGGECEDELGSETESFVWEQSKKEEQHGYFGKRYALDIEDFD